MKISGIIPALVTPFNKNGRVNYSALKSLVKRLTKDGADGFYVCGSTGECFLLSDNERKKILEAVLDASGGRVPIIAHVGKISADEAASLAVHARDAGAAAVSSVPPFYYKFDIREIAAYYRRIALAANLSLIVYSTPALSGVSVTVQSLGEIVRESGAFGLKYTSYDLFELEKIRRRYPEMNIFYGHDECFLNALPIGLAGAIGSTFNIMLPKFAHLKELYMAGDNAGAGLLQGKINDIIEALIETGVNPGIKYLLTKSGIDCGDCREPFAPLAAQHQELLDSLYDAVFSEVPSPEVLSA
jgi:N-acetylneuraminate lyase